jgi:predicted Zn-dependent protease
MCRFGVFGVERNRELLEVTCRPLQPFVGVRVNDSIEPHAPLADNRIKTSGRTDKVDITATVWVERRRGSASGDDLGGNALKLPADEAVQITGASPVHREYVPTPGPLDYGEATGFAAAADIDLAARAPALEVALLYSRFWAKAQQLATSG